MRSIENIYTRCHFSQIYHYDIKSTNNKGEVTLTYDPKVGTTCKIEKPAPLAKKTSNWYANGTYISNFIFGVESCKTKCTIESETVQISKYHTESKSREMEK